PEGLAVQNRSRTGNPGAGANPNSKSGAVVDALDVAGVAGGSVDPLLTGARRRVRVREARLRHTGVGGVGREEMLGPVTGRHVVAGQRRRYERGIRRSRAGVELDPGIAVDRALNDAVDRLVGFGRVRAIDRPERAGVGDGPEVMPARRRCGAALG